jgi:hypothetical protein
MNGPNPLTDEQRQLAACGFLPPPEDRLRPYISAWGGLGYKGDAPTVCPGYSTSLHETIEIARGHIHWDKGSLTEFCGGQPTDGMIRGVEIIDAAVSEFKSWFLDESRDKS